MFEGIDIYRPPFNPLLVGLAIVALTATVIALYAWRTRGAAGSWRRSAMMLLRLAAIAAMAWILAGPSVLRRGERPGRVEVMMLADTSASMAETDEGPDADQSRLDALRRTWLSGAFLDRLRSVADVRFVAFDESSRTVAGDQLALGQADGPQTYLFEALQESLASPRSAVTVLLTDGHDTRTVFDEAVVARLRREARPVFTVPVGRTSGVADVAVQAWADADFLFEGQTTTLHATVIQTGYDHQQVRVELLSSGRLIDTRTVSFADEAAKSVRFEVAPGVDPQSSSAVTLADYLVRVTPEDAARPQRVVENDEQFVFVQVSRDRMKVALFEGEPYWDTRYLAQVVRQDPQADLAAVYRFGPRRQMRVRWGGDSDDTLQVDPGRLTQQQLNAFDVVILGKHAERLFPGQRAQMLVDYVKQRGGALLLARGRAFVDDDTAQQIIAELEPVTWAISAVDELQLELTPQGRTSPLLDFASVGPTDTILTELPGLIAATRIEREKAASLVLLRQRPRQPGVPPMAAVAHQRVGRGQVMAVLGDGLWRWALLPGEQARYDSVYALFWSRAVRWLATGGEFLPGQEVSMKLDRLSVEPNQPVTVTIATRYIEAETFAPQLTLTAPDGQTTTVEPKRTAPASNEYRAVIEPAQTGVWRVSLTDGSDDPRIDPASPMTARLAVYERSLERLDPAARPRVLKQLADATGGACWPVDEPEALLEHLESLRIARESDTTASYDFNRFPVFALIALALGGEWVLRRRGGLL